MVDGIWLLIAGGTSVIAGGIFVALVTRALQRRVMSSAASQRAGAGGTIAGGSRLLVGGRSQGVGRPVQWTRRAPNSWRRRDAADVETSGQSVREPGVRSAYALLCAGVALAGAVAWISQSAAIGLSVAIAVSLATCQYVQSGRDRAAAKFRSQLPELFATLSSSISAGLSMQQAFERAVESLEEPLKSEVHALNSAVALGTPLVTALDELASKSDVAELRAAVLGVGIQHTTGGTMAGVLEQASLQLRQSEQLRRTLRTATAQGRMTLLMVTVVPIGLAAFMIFASDGYVDSFMGTAAGRNLLALAITLEALGTYTVSRILRVEE